MDKKTFTIGVLSITAVFLFIANLIVPPRAAADQLVKDRDYSAVTARIQANDEALYLLDNRTGTMAVFQYDSTKRSLVVRDLQPIMNAFRGAR